MDKSGICKVCTGKCAWNVHFNQKYRFEYENRIERRTFADLQNRYNNATGKKMSVEQVIQRHQKEFLELKRRIPELIRRSHQSLSRLERDCAATKSPQCSRLHRPID